MGRRRTRVLAEGQAGGRLPGTTCLKEREVLQSVSKDIHPDDWPCFVLKDALVYGKDGKTLVNLLHAELEGPFIIRGKLEVDKDFRHLLRVPMSNNLSIEIENSRGFSMGIGPVTIWADGRAGWFEIRPAPAYRKTYDNMSEGVALYFFLTDLYEDIRASKKAKGSNKKTLDVDGIFDLYAEQSKEHLSRADVVQRVDTHATFLLSQMRKPREPIPWTHTMFYRYLIHKFPDLYDRYLKIAGPGMTIQEGAGNFVAESSQAQSKQDSSDEPKLHNPSSIPAEGKQDCAEEVLDLIRNFEASSRHRGQSLTLRRLCKMIIENFDLTTEEAARELLRLHAKSILPILKEMWVESKLYADIEHLIKQPNQASSSNQKGMRKVALRHRRRTEDSGNTHDQSINSDYSGDSRQKTNRIISNRSQSSRKHGRGDVYGQGQDGQILDKKLVSATQPSGRDSEMSDFEIQTGETDGYQSSEPKSMMNETEESATPRRGRRGRPSRSGKAAALRLAGTPLVRARMSSTPSDSEFAEPRLRKRRRLSESSDPENESDIEEIQLPEGQEQVDDTSLYGGIKKELTITSDALLTSSPDQKNGRWTCPHGGCIFSVDNAHEKEGRAEVHAHFLQHADEIVARENLVLQEKRPHLPINNLLEKLRGLGEAARLAEQTEIGGRSIPPPIKRHIIA